MVVPDPNPEVAAVYASYPQPFRDRLLALRVLIFETAAQTDAVGRLTETLKWGEPAYLTEESGSGTTIRLGWSPKRPDECGLYVNCQTGLIADFQARFGDALTYGGKRAVLLDAHSPLPQDALKGCIAMALTYHAHKKAA